VRKLTNKKIRWIIRQLEMGTHLEEVASVMKVTRRRIYQLKRQYQDEGIYPELKVSTPGLYPKILSAFSPRHEILEKRTICFSFCILESSNNVCFYRANIFIVNSMIKHLFKGMIPTPTPYCDSYHQNDCAYRCIQ
jgi:hypothetical protein